MKNVLKSEMRVVAAVAVLLVALSVLAVIASRKEPNVPAYSGVNPQAPIAKPIPPIAPTKAAPIQAVPMNAPAGP